MRIHILYLLCNTFLVLFCFSCSNDSEHHTIANDEVDITLVEDPLPVAEDTTNSAYNTITETVTVLSVAEETVILCI